MNELRTCEQERNRTLSPNAWKAQHFQRELQVLLVPAVSMILI